MSDQQKAADELVDVTDENGNIIGTVTRTVMRSRRLPHRCVYILVFDSSGRILIHRRTQTKDVFPGFWDVAVGGVLAAGEDWHEGAVRETREELGIDIEPIFLGDFQYQDEHAHVFGRVFRVVHDGPFRFQPEEVAEGGFVEPRDFKTRIRQNQFCPDGLTVWELFGEQFAEEITNG
jgi:isopentenyldiphosphate isomerase